MVLLPVPVLLVVLMTPLLDRVLRGVVVVTGSAVMVFQGLLLLLLLLLILG